MDYGLRRNDALIQKDLGFTSHNHFGAAFRQTYARTPAQFQRSIRSR